LVDDSFGSEHNQQILLAGQRAASLTRQLLALSRKQILRPTLLDLGEVTSEIEEMLRRTIGEHITLIIDRYAPVGTIEADRSQIQQALINLTINARDAMPAGGEMAITISDVTVTAADVPPRRFIKEGRYAVLRVRDTGIGMDQATQSRIFEPFFTTKAPSQGTGLGLSTVYGIVKQSKGYIVVDSEPGKGADFRLYFPIVPGVPPEITSLEPMARNPRGTETICLVQDEHALRAITADTLRANGYKVLEALDGQNALDIANSFAGPIDLLLTNVMLPRLSGPRLAQRLTLTRPTTRVIYMSEYSREHDSEQSAVHSRAVLLEKPFSTSSLLQKVRETLDAEDRGADPARPRRG